MSSHAPPARLVAAADPPLLTGGLKHPNRGLRAVNVDWLTATIGTDRATKLRRSTSLDQVGSPRPGFGRSELRAWADGAGTGYRRFEPRQDSRAFGREYESWEWSGSDARLAAPRVRSLGPGTVATRVDVAFDLACDEDVSPCGFIAEVKAHVDAARLKLGIAGEDGINTRYIGSKTSERRIRIYRKDRQSEACALEHGPTLRIELVLKGKQARAWWDQYMLDDELAAQAASGAIETMTGVSLLGGGFSLETEPDKVGPLSERVASFVRQNSVMLAELLNAGVDLGALLEIQEKKQSRSTKWRAKRLGKSLAEYGLDDLQLDAGEIIERHIS